MISSELLSPPQVKNCDDDHKCAVTNQKLFSSILSLLVPLHFYLSMTKIFFSFFLKNNYNMLLTPHFEPFPRPPSTLCMGRYQFRYKAFGLAWLKFIGFPDLISTFQSYKWYNNSCNKMISSELLIPPQVVWRWPQMSDYLTRSFLSFFVSLQILCLHDFCFLVNGFYDLIN